MFELSIALRFLREGRLQTLLIFVGIMTGIAVQVFLASLINGLQRDLVDRTVGSAPHITAALPERAPAAVLPGSAPALTTVASAGEAPRPIRAWEPVARELIAAGWFRAVNPVAEGPAFVFRGDLSRPVVVRGMQPGPADSIYGLRRKLITGTAALTGNGILLGSGLAADLRVRPGSTLRLTTPLDISDIFTVEGVFDLESKAHQQRLDHHAPGPRTGLPGHQRRGHGHRAHRTPGIRGANHQRTADRGFPAPGLDQLAGKQCIITYCPAQPERLVKPDPVHGAAGRHPGHFQRAGGLGHAKSASDRRA
jgi:hypothetical protein